MPYDSIFVAQLSETALTAASLVYAIQFLMIAIGVGTTVGLNALLSRKLGQKKPEEACRAATTGLFLMLGTSLVFTLVGLLFSNQIAAALTNDPELQQLCREYLSVNLVFCFVFGSISVMSSYALQGFSKGVPSLVISAARQVIVLLPLAYVLGNAIGIYGIWWSFLISETVTVVFALLHLAGTEKRELERIAPVL